MLELKKTKCCVPVDKALIKIKERLEEDETLADRTNLSPSDITSLLELCLKCTYCVFRGEFYLPVHGAAMGSPVSPVVCNIYMEDFEKKALMTASHPLEWWFRYADDTRTKQKAHHVEGVHTCTTFIRLTKISSSPQKRKRMVHWPEM